MGGSIKIVTRFSNGEVQGDVRHTNNFPFWIRHPRFIEGDEAFFRKYVEMPSEYKEGDATLAPDEYGVVVIDFKYRTVHVCNNYSHLVRISVFERVHMQNNQFGIGESEQDDEATFREMLEKGYLCLVEQNSLGDRREIELSDVTMENWNNKIDAKYGFQATMNSDTSYSIGIKYPGWTIKQYRADDIASHDELRQNLRNAGFTITEADERKYVAWRDEQIAMLAEDEAPQV
jgi:hypothetical protein